jgi:hypothetical protein
MPTFLSASQIERLLVGDQLTEAERQFVEGISYLGIMAVS